MPTTEYDDEIIADLTAGTKVTHVKRPEYGVGTVSDRAPEYGQIPVSWSWPDQRTMFCYPSNLERAEKKREAEQ